MDREQQVAELKKKAAAFKARACQTCQGRCFVNGQCIACVQRIVLPRAVELTPQEKAWCRGESDEPLIYTPA